MCLVAARLLHAALGAPDLRARLADNADRRRERLTDARRDDIRRAIAGVSRRLPWRSDCMIQALAARLWLDSLGAPSALRLGARRGEGGEMEAHAWLLSDGVPVTGGALDGPFAAFAPPADDGAAR